MPKSFSLLTIVWENLISAEGDDFMGHIRLLVQGQGVDLSRASQILAWTLVGVFGWPQQHRQAWSLPPCHNPYQWQNPYFR